MSNDGDVPIILADRFSILCKGVEKRFGNTDQFRILHELIRRRRRCVSQEDIREVLDKPEMKAAAIRAAIYGIKQKLKPELSDLIPRIQSDIGYYRFD